MRVGFIGIVAVTCAALLALPAQAKLYRWVDENGKVQYSDKPPQTDPKSGISEVDTRGRVIKEPEKKISEEEKARLQAEETKQKEIQRRDRALLQSFSKPEEVDILRDRQIEAVQGQLQTNKLRRQTAEDKLARINKNADTLKKRNKPLPADMEADRAVIQKEIDDIDADSKKKLANIEDIKKRAEDDKKRLVELKALNAH
ncbi:protein of unknown function [Andreprevotia lacus DSM 23236]|jgi:chromosome segregation ATPase|uniref:DUF4124 domain-containing protein n=1 Tax=Andreprevotia lacus DSM 23236 TaxID=1121001 RepID=A0A1W1XBP1_9NEIS|nr:DUF4124 domain-containing protein [Andreprevotia lacus]SMC21204.1 protein of unknown function [Andreprevotia lacus DSM 23236]